MFRPLHKEHSIQSVRLCLIGARELATGKGRTDPKPAILITTTVLEGFGTNETLTTLSRGFGHVHLVEDGPRTGRKICDELHRGRKTSSAGW